MNIVEDARRVFDTARDREVPFKAASFAHYALASLVPLLIVVLAVFSYLGVADTFASMLQSRVPSNVGQILQRVLTAENGRGVAGLIGLLLALWSGLKVFRGLSVAFTDVYDVGADPTLFEKFRDGTIVLGLVLLAFGVLTATGIILRYASVPVPFPRLVGNVVAVIAILISLLPLFYVLPPVPVTVRQILPGATFAAVGWVLLLVAFTIYAGQAGKYAVYGFLGAILLFILFLYFGGIVLLVGAVINVVLERPTPLARLHRRR